MAAPKALTGAEKKALRQALLQGQTSKTSEKALSTALSKLGFQSTLSFVSAFYQHALGRIMNDVVGVEAGVSPLRRTPS